MKTTEEFEKEIRNYINVVQTEKMFREIYVAEEGDDRWVIAANFVDALSKIADELHWQIGYGLLTEEGLLSDVIYRNIADVPCDAIGRITCVYLRN